MSAASAEPSATPWFRGFRGTQLGAKLVIAGLVVLVLLLAGLILNALGFFSPPRETLPVAYGQRRGYMGSRSVNGTAVLAGMFEKAGHKVRSATRLSPNVKKADVIVWAPNDYEPPTKDQREWLENWLGDGYGRMVIYIGRDYDAAPDYWRDVKPNAPPGEQQNYEKNLAGAEAIYNSHREPPKAPEYARWFTRRDDGKTKRVTKLSGPWAEGIDASKVNIPVRSRLDVAVVADRPAKDTQPLLSAQVLLDSDAGPLVTELTEASFIEGSIVIVQNGAFTLNYPLVNHEHRKLAAKLVAHVNEYSESGDVVFIESGRGGPTILEKEPPESEAGGLAFLHVWPLNAVVLHLTLAGIVLCFAVAMIFGRPRELPTTGISDFGRHVAALGRVLAQSKDRAYAQARLAQYRDQAQRASGKSHAKDK
jgi:hypothetical protein